MGYTLDVSGNHPAPNRRQKMNQHSLAVTESPRYAGETEIVQTARNAAATLERYGFGYCGPNETCRRVQGGPLLPGPFAFAYRLGNCIDGRKADFNDIHFNIGDTFEIDGHIFKTRRTHNENIELDLVS